MSQFWFAVGRACRQRASSWSRCPFTTDLRRQVVDVGGDQCGGMPSGVKRCAGGARQCAGCPYRGAVSYGRQPCVCIAGGRLGPRRTRQGIGRFGCFLSDGTCSRIESGSCIYPQRANSLVRAHGCRPAPRGRLLQPSCCGVAAVPVCRRPRTPGPSAAGLPVTPCRCGSCSRR